MSQIHGMHMVACRDPPPPASGHERHQIWKDYDEPIELLIISSSDEYIIHLIAQQ